VATCYEKFPLKAGQQHPNDKGESVPERYSL
jgi:hypothetical protein